MLFLITLPAISTPMRGSPLKRSSYSGVVESVEVFPRYGYRAANDAPAARGESGDYFAPLNCSM